METGDDKRAPTRRFSDRVEYYVKYRPHYPAAILPFLEEAIGLTPQWDVADVGAGTGILSQLFLNYGCTVCGVEPNAEMRAAAAASLGEVEHFHLVAGTAADTTLPAQSVDLVMVGQAFHWFDLEAARREFVRILRPGGILLLVYNDWDHNSPVVQGYKEVVKRYGLDYDQARYGRKLHPERLAAFFAPATLHTHTLRNGQIMDFEALLGRALSTSYVPLPGHPNYEPLAASLRRVFERLQEGGRVHFDYITRMGWGRLAGRL